MICGWNRFSLFPPLFRSRLFRCQEQSPSRLAGAMHPDFFDPAPGAGEPHHLFKRIRRPVAKDDSALAREGHRGPHSH